MIPEELIKSLEASGQALVSFYGGVTADQSVWKPAPEKWSLLEVLGHLCDEERDDFRKRLALTLEDPGRDWPPIDPEGWARDRDYNGYDLKATLDDFIKERKASIEWLKSLKNPEWANEFTHDHFGGIKAGDLFCSWAAHDLLHLQQVMKIRLALISETASPYSTRYATP